MDQQVDNRRQLIKEIFRLVHEEDLPSLILKYKITRGELADALRPLNYEVTETGFLIEEVKELARGQDVDLSFLSEPKESPLTTYAATQSALVVNYADFAYFDFAKTHPPLALPRRLLVSHRELLPWSPLQGLILPPATRMT
jgi:hypothetical protein